MTITGCPLGLIHIIPLGIKIRYRHMREPDNLDVFSLSKKIIERDGQGLGREEVVHVGTIPGQDDMSATQRETKDLGIETRFFQSPVSVS